MYTFEALQSLIIDLLKKNLFFIVRNEARDYRSYFCCRVLFLPKSMGPLYIVILMFSF